MATASEYRAERLLALVSLFLGADHPITWDELVEAFPGDYGTGTRSSCTRKWERDKAELVELGIPLLWIKGEEERPDGYVVDRATYYLRDLELAPEERALLSVAGAAALEQPAFPLRTDLAHALNKLFFHSPPGSPGQGASRLVVHLPSAGAERQAGVLEQLGQALALRKVVEFSYRAFGGQATERTVAPYGLAYRRGAWFLLGHCYLRGALRIFQIERIAELRVNESRPRVPDFEVPAGFDVRAVIGREPWEFAVHPSIAVEVRLAREVALLARSRFGDAATITPAEDGAVCVRFGVTYGEAIVREVLRLSPHAELVAPAELRARVVEAAGRIAEGHEGSAPAAATVGGVDESNASGEEGRAGGVVAEAPPLAASDGDAVGPHQETAAGDPSSPAAGSANGPAHESQASRKAPSKAPAGTTVPGDLRERLRRALFIVPYVVANPGCPVEEVAKAARLTTEQLLAELDFLRMIGRPPFSPADLVDIDVFDGKVEVALPQGLLRPPSLTPLEAAALYTAASALAVEGGLALARAREKLRAALPPGRQEQFDSVAGRVQLDDGGIEAAMARLIDAAIEEKRELEFTYWTAGRGEASRRRVRPLERVLHQGYWYLHAYCCDRFERRLFRLDRAVDLAPTDKTFVPRAGDDAARFRRESIYEPSPHARMATVRIAAGPWAVADQTRRLGATGFRALPDGRGEALFPVDGEAFVAATVLSLGGDAELLEPRELRDRIGRVSREVAARHTVKP